VIISVDGPDCAGKSTFVERITERFITEQWDVISLHAGPPKSHPLDEYERPIYERHNRLFTDRRTALVLDRWDVGEQVYPAVVNRLTQLDVPVQRHIELFKRRYGFIEIIINPGVKRLQDCMATRPEAERDYTNQQLAELHQRFANLDSTGNHRLYFSLLDPVDALESILDLAYGLDDDAQGLAHLVTYVGQPRPRFLLFGERRGTREQYLTMGRAPAFGPYVSTSGHYLLTHLDVPRMGGGLANACDVDDPKILWDYVKQPPVVALGVNAHETLEAAGVPHGSMPHPQYVRRFHYSHGRQYAAAIIETVQSQRNELKWRP